MLISIADAFSLSDRYVSICAFDLTRITREKIGCDGGLICFLRFCSLEHAIATLFCRCTDLHHNEAVEDVVLQSSSLQSIQLSTKGFGHKIGLVSSLDMAPRYILVKIWWEEVRGL